MRARPPAVFQNVGVRAARPLQVFGKFGHLIKGPPVVDGPRGGDDGGGEPAAIDGRGAEGVADNVTNEGG